MVILNQYKQLVKDALANPDNLDVVGYPLRNPALRYGTNSMADNSDSDTDTKLYTLKPGASHWAISGGERKEFQPGDQVELSEDQFQAFKDKFFDPDAPGAAAQVAALAEGVDTSGAIGIANPPPVPAQDTAADENAVVEPVVPVNPASSNAPEDAPNTSTVTAPTAPDAPDAPSTSSSSSSSAT